MFRLLTRKARTEPAPTVSLLGMWELSEEIKLLDKFGAYSYAKLETLKVDLKRQISIWKDGKARSIVQVAQRLNMAKPHVPIEDSVMSGLVEAYEPEGITDGNMEEDALLRSKPDWKQAKKLVKPQKLAGN